MGVLPEPLHRQVPSSGLGTSLDMQHAISHLVPAGPARDALGPSPLQRPLVMRRTRRLLIPTRCRRHRPPPSPPLRSAAGPPPPRPLPPPPPPSAPLHPAPPAGVARGARNGNAQNQVSTNVSARQAGLVIIRSDNMMQSNNDGLPWRLRFASKPLPADGG